MIIIIIIIIIIILIIIMITAFKGAIQIFCNLLTASRTISNMYVKVAQAPSCAIHMQHMERLSCTTCRVMCQVVRTDSSAVRNDRAYIAFI